MYPNNNDTIRIDANNFVEPKIIRNPLYRHIDYPSVKFATETFHTDTEPVIRMYRYRNFD